MMSQLLVRALPQRILPCPKPLSWGRSTSTGAALSPHHTVQSYKGNFNDCDFGEKHLSLRHWPPTVDKGKPTKSWSQIYRWTQWIQLEGKSHHFLVLGSSCCTSVNSKALTKCLHSTTLEMRGSCKKKKEIHRLLCVTPAPSFHLQFRQRSSQLVRNKIWTNTAEHKRQSQTRVRAGFCLSLGEFCQEDEPHPAERVWDLLDRHFSKGETPDFRRASEGMDSYHKEFSGVVVAGLFVVVFLVWGSFFLGWGVLVVFFFLRSKEKKLSEVCSRKFPEFANKDGSSAV